MIYPFLNILAMPSHFISRVYHMPYIYYRNTQRFIMAMPFNLILILYVLPCILSCDFRKITILYYIYMYVHTLDHFYEKNKYLLFFLCQ